MKISPAALILILCIAGAFVAAIIYAVRANARRTALLQGIAASQGWSFQPRDGEGLSSKIEGIFPDRLFQVENIVTVETGDRALRFFDCQYRLRERRSGGSFGMGCILESPRFRSLGETVDIVPRSRFNAAASANRVDMGETEFSKHFIVTAQDRSSAERAVTPALQAFLLGRGRTPLKQSLHIAISASGAVVLTNKSAGPEPWRDLVELSRGVEANLP